MALAGMQERKQQKAHSNQQECQLLQGCQPQEDTSNRREARDTSNNRDEKKQGHQQSKHSNSGVDCSSRRVNRNIRDANSSEDAGKGAINSRDAIDNNNSY
jgi:hypothetical protein